MPFLVGALIVSLVGAGAGVVGGSLGLSAGGIGLLTAWVTIVFIVLCEREKVTC